jgi:hypothetical protein
MAEALRKFGELESWWLEVEAFVSLLPTSESRY